MTKYREQKKSLRLFCVIISLLLVFLGIALFANKYIFTLVVLILLYDYFILIGGNLHWLNRIIDDDDYSGTGVYRRMLSADAKMIILGTFTGLWLVFLNDYQLYLIEDIGGYSQYHMTVFDFFKAVYNKTFTLNEEIPLIIYIFFIKASVLGQIIHSIHHILINEKLAGMKFTGYIPLTSVIRKIVTWGRNGRYE